MKQNNEISYLTNIPQFIEKYGLCKTMMVRREMIHLKHVLTEIFVRKSIKIQDMLDYLNMDIFQYMEIITNKIRRIHHISRNYRENMNKIIKTNSDSFTRMVNLYDSLNENFHKLYIYFVKELKVKSVICSGNPTITSEWFIKNNLPLPTKIYPNKGKLKKIRKLIELSKQNDYLFYIDNETNYLEYGWIFGLKTYLWDGKKFKCFSLKTK